MSTYVVAYFAAGKPIPAEVSRSREYCLKIARQVWAHSCNGQKAKYPGLWKIEVYKCEEHRDFKLIKRFS